MNVRAITEPRIFVSGAAALGLVACACIGGASAADASPAAGVRPACIEVQSLTYSAADQAAKPLVATQCIPIADAVTGAAASAPRATSPTATSAGTTTTAFPTIGKLTFKADGLLGLSCTATVIQGTKVPNSEELIATAAHCVEGVTDRVPYTSTNLAFSPMWHDNQSPLGVWTARKVFLNSGWMHCPIPVVNCTTNPADDYAIIVLNPQNGRGVGDVTGADGWLVNQPAAIAGVTVAGIPSNSPRTLLAVSNTTTVTQSGVPYRQATTPGFTDGSSGGPWLEHFDDSTGVGTLIGDTGGFEQGGPASGSPSFTDTWNSAFASVVAAATNFEG